MRSPRRDSRSSQLDESLSEKFEQAKKDGNTVAAAGAWITDQRFQFALGVTARTQSVIRLGQISYTTGYRSALARRSAWQRTLRQVFEKVDLIALPTLQKTTAGTAATQLENRHPRSTRPSGAKYGGG